MTDPAMQDSAAARAKMLSELRAKLRGLASGHTAIPPRFVFGLPALDAALGGGLQRAAIHDVLGEVPGSATGFCVTLAASLDGPVVWIAARSDLYGPGLVEAGLDLSRLIVVEAGRHTLWACEEALRTKGVAAVVAECRQVNLTASRRLQLAAESGGAIGLLLREAATTRGATAARTRLRIGSLASGLASPRWRLMIERAAGGAPAQFALVWDKGVWRDVRDIRPAHRVGLAAQPADRPARSAAARV
jgi:protein ImuA